MRVGRFDIFLAEILISFVGFFQRRAYTSRVKRVHYVPENKSTDLPQFVSQHIVRAFPL